MSMTNLEESPDVILGEEFLTWLWYKSDTAPDSFHDSNGLPFNIYIEQRIVVRGGQGDSRDTASVGGSLSPLREARFGLGEGKKVCRALIRIEKDDFAFQLSLKAEDFSLSSIKTPKIEKEDKDEDPDAPLLEKIYFLEICIKILDEIYLQFLKLRLSPEWPAQVGEMSSWLHETG